MKSVFLLALLCVAAQCGALRIPRDVSELVYSNPGFQPRPAYWNQQGNSEQGYDYPRPGSRPVFRDPEPLLPDTVPIQSRPAYTTTQYVPRPAYRPQQNPGFNYNNNVYPTQTYNRVEPSERLLWPLINKISGLFSQNGQTNPWNWNQGTNSIGYPSTSNQYPNYPTLFPNKFTYMNGLSPNNYNTNYQRFEIPAAVPVTSSISVNTVSDGGTFGTDYQQPGVGSLGGDSVVVDAAPDPSPIPAYLPSEGEGYNYPNPNELQPPHLSPDGLQFKVQPSKLEDNDN